MYSFSGRVHSFSSARAKASPSTSCLAASSSLLCIAVEFYAILSLLASMLMIINISA